MQEEGEKVLIELGDDAREFVESEAFEGSEFYEGGDRGKRPVEDGVEVDKVRQVVTDVAEEVLEAPLLSAVIEHFITGWQHQRCCFFIVVYYTPVDCD